MYTAIIVGFILAVLWFIEKVGGTPMVIRPIVVSPIVGLALGDLKTGLLIGATLELVFMGAIQIGGAVPPDVLVGSGLGTAFAIMNGQGADVALALALPIAVVAQSLKVIVFIMRSWFMDFALKLAAGLLLQCIMYFVVAFVAIAVGADAVESIIASIPEGIMGGLKIAGGLLPAVGFALLLQPMLTSKNIIYFVIGFACVAYLNLPVLAVTIFAIGIAYVVCFDCKNSNGVIKKDEMEELFDE